MQELWQDEKYLFEVVSESENLSKKTLGEVIMFLNLQFLVSGLM